MESGILTQIVRVAEMAAMAAMGVASKSERD
jgi:hypothetical protein